MERRVLRPGLSILEAINEAAADEQHRDKVTVYPFMCGTGKSKAITEKIKETIDRIKAGGNTGLIVVTDTINGLQAYVKPNYDEALCAYFEENKSQWRIITVDNASRLKSYVSKCPILLMTTQRYFQMPRENIESMIHGGTYNRPLILIDEAPYLIDGEAISLFTLGEYDSFFLDELAKKKFKSPIDRNEVYQRILLRTSHLKYNLIKSRDTFTEATDGEIHFHYENSASLRAMEEADSVDISSAAATPEEQQLIDAMNEQAQYNQSIRRKDDLTPVKVPFRIKRLLKSFDELYSHGGIQFFQYSDKADAYYANGYYPTWNNRGQLTDLPAKIIILDGTADIHPDYEQDYMDPVDCKEYRRVLDKLTIHIIDTPTGKTKMAYENDLTKNGIISEHRQAINDYISEHCRSEQPVFFTYKDFEQLFYASQRMEKKANTAHFGAIKGRNDFVKHNAFVQVGVFKAPEYYYYARYLQIHPELLEPYKGDGIHHAPDAVDALAKIQKTKNYQLYKALLMLVDIEQNIFRSSIRDPSSTKKVHYYIFAAHKYYALLFKKLTERFKDDYGAHVISEKLPKQSEPDKKPVAKQKQHKVKRVDLFLDWLNEQPATGIRLKAFKEKYQLSEKQMEKLRGHPIVKSVIRRMPHKNEYEKVIGEPGQE